MNKAVMISIKPKWVELIASGRKTVEVRKNRPKIDVPFLGYIYCTKSDGWYGIQSKGNQAKRTNAVGKVVGEFVCDKIGDYVYGFSFNSERVCISLRTQACLTHEEVWDYSGGKDLYGWHISNLKMYETPKELSDFQMINTYKGKWNSDGKRSKRIVRPFQSWGYVEELE